MRTANSIREQCRIQLALEQTQIVARLRVADRTDEARGFDPIGEEWTRQMRTKLHRIEHALQRFAEGRFGMCETCHQPIDAERLLALPSAELCIDCQRQLERQVLGHRWLKEARNVAA